VKENEREEILCFFLFSDFPKIIPRGVASFPNLGLLIALLTGRG